MNQNNQGENQLSSPLRNVMLKIEANAAAGLVAPEQARFPLRHARARNVVEHQQQMTITCHLPLPAHALAHPLPESLRHRPLVWNEALHGPQLSPPHVTAR